MQASSHLPRARGRRRAPTPDPRRPRESMAAIIRLIKVMASSSSQVEAIPTSGGAAAASTTSLFACGSHGVDVAAQTTEVAHLFGAAKTVCCDDMQEQCDAAKPLPGTCTTVEYVLAPSISWRRRARQPSLPMGFSARRSSRRWTWWLRRVGRPNLHARSIRRPT